MVGGGIDVTRDFLTGSYGRHTKTKPLKDVDIFVVLGPARLRWRGQPALGVLQEIERILVGEFGGDRVEIARRSVHVDFGVHIVDDVSDKVVSLDVVPAFEEGGYFVIPRQEPRQVDAHGPPRSTRPRQRRPTRRSGTCGSRW